MQESNTSEDASAQAGCGLRLFWMLVGNAIIFSSLAFIAINQLVFPSAFDGVVWFTVALIILARRLDIVRWHGTTAIGEPATLAHLRRHAATVILVTALASVVAHRIAL